jgi:Tol biopolymer transport system component
MTIVDFEGTKMNLTANWDGTVDSFIWSKDGKKIYFIAATDGTKQVFEVNFPARPKSQSMFNKLPLVILTLMKSLGFRK